MMKKTAFTMIELVFIIVVLGILAAIAVPKFGATRDDAVVAKGRSEVSSIRAAIESERQRRVIKGDYSYPAHLDDAAKNTEHEELFDGTSNAAILKYPIYSKSKSGNWMKSDTDKYKYYIKNDTTVTFDYDSASGSFDCDHDDSNCKILTE
jgi:general secretion pathway protein G